MRESFTGFSLAFVLLCELFLQLNQRVIYLEYLDCDCTCKQVNLPGLGSSKGFGFDESSLNASHISRQPETNLAQARVIASASLR